MTDKKTTEEQQETINDLLASNKSLKGLNRSLTSELIEIKIEKAHNEQILDAFQNVLADFGYKLVDAND